MSGDRELVFKGDLEEKLDKIIELLEKIDKNTTPVPSWAWPTIATGQDNYDGNNPWITIEPYVPSAAPVSTCGCSSCKSSTANVGGCVKCGCRNIAIFTEDGNWWCNKCHQNTFYDDGSLKPC